jgi:imidazolonepropionase-like amidohydrolase
MTAGSDPLTLQFGADVLRAVVDQAHGAGLPVTAHAHSCESIAIAVAAGVDGIEHASFMTAEGVEAPDALIRAIVERRITIGTTVGRRPGHDGTPPPAIASRMNGMIAARRQLVEAGASIVAGTDAGIAPIKPHDVLSYAAEDLKDAGMSPIEALWTITSRAAHACGLGHRKGRLTPGYDADILAIDGNPFEDLTTLRNIRAVFARGRQVPAGEGDCRIARSRDGGEACRP